MSLTPLESIYDTVMDTKWHNKHHLNKVFLFSKPKMQKASKTSLTEKKRFQPRSTEMSLLFIISQSLTTVKQQSWVRFHILQICGDAS